jgi:hypothetical protein
MILQLRKTARTLRKVVEKKCKTTGGVKHRQQSQPWYMGRGEKTRKSKAATESLSQHTAQKHLATQEKEKRHYKNKAQGSRVVGCGASGNAGEPGEEGGKAMDTREMGAT